MCLLRIGLGLLMMQDMSFAVCIRFGLTPKPFNLHDTYCPTSCCCCCMCMSKTWVAFGSQGLHEAEIVRAIQKYVEFSTDMPVKVYRMVDRRPWDPPPRIQISPGTSVECLGVKIQHVPTYYCHSLCALDLCVSLPLALVRSLSPSSLPPALPASHPTSPFPFLPLPCLPPTLTLPRSRTGPRSRSLYSLFCFILYVCFHKMYIFLYVYIYTCFCLDITCTK